MSSNNLKRRLNTRRRGRASWPHATAGMGEAPGIPGLQAANESDFEDAQEKGAFPTGIRELAGFTVTGHDDFEWGNHNK